MAKIETKKPQELRKMLGEAQKEAREARFAAAGSRVRNTKELRTIRKQIARIMTALTASRKQEITN